ncbi:MAG: YhdP family protein, partial [Luteimonas sp.]
GEGRTGIRVAVGAARVDEAPPMSGLIATGRATDLDAIDWATLAAGSGQRGPDARGDNARGSGSPLQLLRVDVSADRLKLLGGSFANARVRAAPSAAGTAVQVDGDTLAGLLTLPRASGAAITGQFSRVHWAAPSAPAAVAAPPTPSTVAPDPAAAVDPARIPALQFTIDDLRFGNAVLGRTTLRTQPVAGGLRIAELRTATEPHKIAVTGDWLGTGVAERTRIKVQVTSGDFGKLLSGFGFGGRLAGGTGEATFDAAWPSNPAGFSLGTLEGRLSLLARDGRLIEIEPGAGRVLGLLSVAELPRRLLLDFRDFFSKGFAFNRIGGNVRFAAGQARSDDLVIDGPAAEIRITGAADLRAQTFDQTIAVLPKSGNLLTVAGALAGGPVGAAVGAVANAVLRKPLGEAGAKIYRVTGPWTDPRVEVGKHENADVRQAADAPAAAE